MIIQGSQLLWYPRSSQTTRQDSTTPASGAKLNRSLEIADPSWWGSGRAVPPAALSGPGDQGWFGQFGAVSITKAPSSLIVHNTSGNILIGGNAYSLAAGQCDVCTSPFSGEWDGAKNSGQCAFSLVANRSTSAVPYRVQIIRTDPRCNLHSPWGIPLPQKSICPAVQETGDVRCSDGEKVKVPCLYRALDRTSLYKEALVIYVRNHRHVVGTNKHMPLFQLRP